MDIGGGNSTRRSIAADLVLLTHALFALFSVFGGLLLLLDPRIAFVHLPTVLWSSWVNLANRTCPLTPLEKRLRIEAGQMPFEGGWIQHYLDPLVRPFGMPRRAEIVAGWSVLVWNALVYGWVLAHAGANV